MCYLPQRNKTWVRGLWVDLKDNSKVYKVQERKREKLVKKAKRGDAHAFETLIKSYSKYITCIALQVLKNEHDAKDAVQNAVLSMYQNIKDLKDTSAFNTWMYTIVYNASTKVYKKRGRELPREDIDMDFLEEGMSFCLPENSRDKKEDKELLLEKIEALPAHYSTALFLYYFEDMSYEAIAKIMGAKPHDITNWLHRARNKLGKMIAKDEKTKHLSKRALGTEGAALTSAFALNMKNVDERYAGAFIDSALGKMREEGVLVNTRASQVTPFALAGGALLLLLIAGMCLYLHFSKPASFETSESVSLLEGNTSLTESAEEESVPSLNTPPPQVNISSPATGVPSSSPRQRDTSFAIENTASYEVGRTASAVLSEDKEESAVLSGTTNTVATALEGSACAVSASEASALSANTGDSLYLISVALAMFLAACLLFFARRGLRNLRR